MGSLLNTKNKKQLLAKSIVSSIVLHLASLALVQQQSVWFSKPSANTHSEKSWISSIEKHHKDQILKESFIPGPKEKKIASSSPQPEKVAPLALQISPVHILERKDELPARENPKPVFPVEPMLSSLPSISFSLPAKDKLDLFDHIPKDLILPAPSQSFLIEPSLLPQILSIHLTLPHTTIPGVQNLIPSFSTEEKKPLLAQNPEIEKELPSHPLSFAIPRSMPKLHSLSEMKSISHSDDFETELVFVPVEGEGYIFALTLIPRSDLQLSSMKQNYFFLIDRSNSVQKERLQSAKGALSKALEELGENDTFNIIAFDSKVEKLFTTSRKPDRETIQQARIFLESIELGSFFSQTDITKPLFLTVPSQPEFDELYTAILLTDGESFGKRGVAKTLLQDWTQYNNGKVSLFALSMGGDVHAATLDAASAFNRGKFAISPSKRGLKRKLLKIMKSVRNPIAKNLSCKAISRTPHSSIQIYPKSHQMPHLYLNEPYVIMGKTATLDDFILFVQGQIKGEWFHIKKTISFLNAKKGNASLKSEFALQKAYDLYDQYLIDNEDAHIAEAKTLLESHNLQAAFE